MSLNFEELNSQAPDVTELAHQGIFSSHGSVHVCETDENPLLNRTDFFKIKQIFSKFLTEITILSTVKHVC